MKEHSDKPSIPPKARIPFRFGFAQGKSGGEITSAATEEDESGLIGAITPMRLVRVVVRKWFTIALMVGFAVTVAFFYLWKTPKIYRASSLIEMTQRRPRIMKEAGAVIEDQGYEPAKEIFNTRLRKFSGQALREMAFDRFKAAYPARGRSENELRSLMGAVNFNLLGESRIVQITAERPEAELCSAVVNAYAEATEIFTLEENRREAENAVEWLRKQAEAQKLELEKAEQDILDFRKATQIDVLENKKKSIEDAIVELRKSLVSIETELVLAEQMRDSLQKLDITPESVNKLPGTVPRFEDIQAAVMQWNSSLNEKAALLTRYTEKHPKVIAKNDEIEARKNSVISAIRGAVETADSNHRLLKQQTESLRQKLDEQSREATDLERRLIEGSSKLTTLVRARDAFDASHKGLLERMEEARFSVEETTTTVKLVEKADIPRVPVSPVASRIWLMAVFFGLSAGFVLALVTDTLEDRITGTYDVEHGLGLKILGLIPHVSRKNRKDLALAALDEKQANISEAYSGVRSILEIRRMSQGCGSALMVCSTAPEEGKTVTACNIAVSFARSGKRTLLVDLDLRRPRVGRIFGMESSQVCLIDALGRRDEALFDKLPFDTNIENLSVIGSSPSGQFSASEVLDGSMLSKFFSWAKQKYDLVVIDTPPVGVVADALLLAKFGACVVMVCRPDVSRKRATRYAVRQLMDAGADVMGAVVNDVNFARSPYFSNYDHHYNYSHYGYYYSSKTEEEYN